MGMGWKPTVDHGGPHWTTLDHGGALWTTLDHGGAEAYSGITLDHSLEQQKPQKCTVGFCSTMVQCGPQCSTMVQCGPM